MKKKVIAISLSTLLIFLTLGGLIAVNSYAIDRSSAYVWIPQISDNSAQSILDDGLFVYSRYYFGHTDTNSYKVAIYYNSGNSTYIAVFACAKEIASSDQGLYRVDSRSLTVTHPQLANITGNIKYFTYTVDISTVNSSIPVYQNQSECFNALDDGIWTEAPPVDPEFQFDISLGYLKNVQWKQIALTDTNETVLEITYDQYTSTGFNLYNGSCGVGYRYLAYNSVDNTKPFWVSDPFFHSIIQYGEFWSQIALSWTPDFIIDAFHIITGTPGGGGHSFELPEDTTKNNDIVSVDIILFPYYYDGQDYYYGYNTEIKNVHFDYIGTRLIPTENNLTDVDTYMNNTAVNNFYYDYGIDAGYIDNSYNVFYYTTQNVFNYTGVGNSEDVTINDIENSTNNVYNFVGVGSMPDLDIDGLNLNPSQVIDTVKGVITALIVASPLLMGLFDFLPYWAVSLSIACCIAVAVICVIRIFKVGG